jgi:hypothetical protein
MRLRSQFDGRDRKLRRLQRYQMRRPIGGRLGNFAFKEFRRDPEDGGGWTLVADYSATRFPTKEAAVSAAAKVVPWFGAIYRSRDANDAPSA